MLDAVNPCRGDNDVADDCDIERSPKFHESASDPDVLLAGGRVATWMIVHENDACGGVLHRAAEDRARIECQVSDRPVLDLLVGDQAVCTVEKKDAQNFFGEGTHRGHQVPGELRTAGIERLRDKVRPQAFDDQFTGTEQDRRERAVRAQYPPEGFGCLREDASQTAKLIEKRLC